MGMAIVDKIPNIQFAGLRFSDAAKGLVVAGAGDALSLLINRYSQGKVPPVAIRLGAAWLVQWKTVKDVLGPNAANIGSLFLVADAIRSLYDVRGQTRNTLVRFIPNVGTGVTPAGQTGAQTDAGSPAAESEVAWG